MKHYTLVPQDLLFFRDARPMETGGGHGARWPEPSVIFDALHAALWRAFPKAQPWEHEHCFGRSSDRDPHRKRSQRFGSLFSAGLFPVWNDGRWLLPAPGDVIPSDDENRWLLVPQAPRGATNLPAPFLQYTLASRAQPSKDTVPAWWTPKAWKSYLKGEKPAPAELFDNEDLFATEWTTGIGMDPETQTQDGQRIYSAEYLRLRPDVSCGFAASLSMKQNDNGKDIYECIDRLFVATDTIIVGGQQRPCKVQSLDTPSECRLPVGATDSFQQSEGKWLVKWILLTPAIWPAIAEDKVRGITSHPGGWLPNWICSDTGKVLLRRRVGNIRRIWDETRGRTVRKADVDEPIAAHLAAAFIPKPVPITGWTERLHLREHESHWTQDGAGHGPRATHLAVPAGAVYYFEADSAEAAAHLAGALNWHGNETNPQTITNRRSTLLGEKGFGLGVCGTWNFYEDVPERPKP